MTLTIDRMTESHDLLTIRAMFQEYADSLGFDLGFQNFTKELADLPGKYGPPLGCMVLARVDGQPAGCVALRPLSDDVCEMKRLYVRPAYRGLGLGRALAERIVQEARDLGYKRMRLDTVRSRMGSAVSLYESLGFRPIPPYCDNPFPDAMFLETNL